MQQALAGKTGEGTAIEREWTIETRDLGFEFMMNALRLIDGVPVTLFKQRTGLDIHTLETAIKQAKAKGLLVVENGYIKPTLLGQRFLNELLALFLE